MNRFGDATEGGKGKEKGGREVEYLFLAASLHVKAAALSCSLELWGLSHRRYERIS